MNINELYEVLLSDKPSEKLIQNEELLFSLIPELKACKGFNQNNDWHPYDVYNHILHVVDYVPNDLVLRLTALFHDIGKPLSYTEDDKKIGHFFGHWVESKKIFDAFSVKHQIDPNMSKVVSNLILYHDKNLTKLSDEELDYLINILGSDGVEKLYKLKKADLLAQNSKYHYILDDYDNQKAKILSRKK